MAGQPDDLKPVGFPDDLDWSAGNLRGSLDRLRDFSVAEGNKANDWYLSKRVRKRVMGISFRVTAIIATAAAGLIPVISQLWQESGVPVVAPGWSPLLLGVAGICILLDRFLGQTSAWLRYVSASQDIGDRLRKFRFDWELLWFNLNGGQPTPEQTQQMINQCRSLVADVDKIVRDETQTWVDEFRTALKQIDLAAEKAPKTTAPGGIDVEVTNSNQLATAWTLSIDDGDAAKHSGKIASVTGLAPGIHKVSVTGVVAGKDVAAEQNVEVGEGKVAKVSLTLS